MIRTLFSLALVMALTVGGAHAATPKKLGQYSYWSVYALKEGKSLTCYMSITAKPPKTKKKMKRKRGDVTLMVTHRPDDGALDVVSYAAGGRLKPASSVKTVIGDKSYSLFTNADTAWARDSATDHELAMALRAGYYVTFLGRLSSGDKFADTVNLKGSAKAYEAMSKACGVKILPVSSSVRPNYKKSKRKKR